MAICHLGQCKAQRWSQTWHLWPFYTMLRLTVGLRKRRCLNGRYWWWWWVFCLSMAALSLIFPPFISSFPFGSGSDSVALSLSFHRIPHSACRQMALLSVYIWYSTPRHTHVCCSFPGILTRPPWSGLASQLVDQYIMVPVLRVILWPLTWPPGTKSPSAAIIAI